ncbi:MAG: hypothetical protein ABH886_02445 [Candidatus Desantisbacteria bacterium]
MKKLMIGFAVFLSVLGILFLGILIEEGFHVLHNRGAKSVCIDFNHKINDSVQKGYLTAHTEYDNSKWKEVEEFYTFKEYTEKIANYLFPISLIILSILFGYGIASMKKGSVKPTRRNKIYLLIMALCIISFYLVYVS